MGIEAEINFEGVCDCTTFYEGTKKLFEKNFQPLEGKLLNKLELALFKKFFQNLPLNKHRIITLESKKYLEKELKTWGLWRESGIPCLELNKIENNKIFWGYLENSTPLGKHLSDKKDTLGFENFLDLYNSIRNLAKKKQDPDYFHSDPHLNNFLIGNKEIVPIDPGSLLNKKMSLAKLDFHLLYHTLFSIVNLNCPKENKIDYVSSFKEILKPEEIELFLNHNYKVPNLSRSYFYLREIFASKIRVRERENRFEVQDRFNQDFKDYVKDILMK